MRAFADLEIIAIVVAKLVFLDLILNQEHSGYVHFTGPMPDPGVVKLKKGPVGITGFGAALAAPRSWEASFCASCYETGFDEDFGKKKEIHLRRGLSPQKR